MSRLCELVKCEIKNQVMVIPSDRKIVKVNVSSIIPSGSKPFLWYIALRESVEVKFQFCVAFKTVQLKSFSTNVQAKGSFPQSSDSSFSGSIKPFDGLDHKYTLAEHLQHIEARVTFSFGLQPTTLHENMFWHARRMASMQCSLTGTTPFVFKILTNKTGILQSKILGSALPLKRRPNNFKLKLLLFLKRRMKFNN